MTYAANTSVSVERSRAEIESTLTRYGATSFSSGWQSGAAAVMFEADGRFIRFVLPLPDRQAQRFTRTATGRARSASEAEKAWKQEERARWRALLLVIKAKLEAVEAGITTFEQEFLANVVLPDGGTVGEWVGPQLDKSYSLGSMPSMLGLPRGES